MAILTGADPGKQGILRDGEALDVPGWRVPQNKIFPD
jgi:hypothetical protein